MTCKPMNPETKKYLDKKFGHEFPCEGESFGSQACYKATDLVEYGYAPGNYTNTCQLCEQEFRGDKRARACKECALSRRHDDPFSAPLYWLLYGEQRDK